jgi:hypothetical protein
MKTIHRKNIGSVKIYRWHTGHEDMSVCLTRINYLKPTPRIYTGSGIKMLKISRGNLAQVFRELRQRGKVDA